MSSKERRKPFAVGQGRRRGSIANGDQVPHTGGLGDRRTNSGATGQKEDFLRLVIEEVVHDGCTPTSITLLWSNIDDRYTFDSEIISLPHCHSNEDSACTQEANQLEH